MNTQRPLLVLAFTAFVALVAAGLLAAEEKPGTEDAPTSSILAKAVQRAAPQAEDGQPHALRDASMFALEPQTPRKFKKHDLVQIIVRETSKAESTHDTETKKDYKLNGKISAWPDLTLTDLLNLQIFAGRTVGLPELGVDYQRDFKGEGDYKREDDLTARLTAEVFDILPNGHLVLEARTHIKTDEEEATIRVTGICRPEDVSAANTVLSGQIHDLKIEKIHRGQLKKNSEKGLIARILDSLFAF